MKGTIINKSHILDNPDFYREEPLLILRIRQESIPGLIELWKKSPVVEITLEPEEKDPTDRARRFFFKLRDIVCEAMGDSSPSHKEHIYRSCIKELKLKDAETGRTIDTIKKLNRNELRIATELMYQWSIDAEAYTADLKPEYDFLQGLKHD